MSDKQPYKVYVFDPEQLKEFLYQLKKKYVLDVSIDDNGVISFAWKPSEKTMAFAESKLKADIREIID